MFNNTPKKLKKIHKNTIKANFRKGIPFKGYICKDNVNSFHVNSGYHIGAWIECSTLEELEKTYNGYMFYNSEKETGNRAIFWVEID